MRKIGFSPLRDGDSIEGPECSAFSITTFFVSVPFAMGTALKADGFPAGAILGTGFSPLRDGDSIEGETGNAANGFRTYVSVPFAMGTALKGLDLPAATTVYARFQSPSRWGQH